MYIMRSQYGHKQYTHFTLSPNKEILLGRWEIWQASLGYRATLTCYWDWSRGRTYEMHYWSLTRKGVRNKIARQIRSWHRQEERYYASKEESKR